MSNELSDLIAES